MKPIALHSLQVRYAMQEAYLPTHSHTVYQRGLEVLVSHLQMLCRFLHDTCYVWFLKKYHLKQVFFKYQFQTGIQFTNMWMILSNKLQFRQWKCAEDVMKLVLDWSHFQASTIGSIFFSKTLDLHQYITLFWYHF